MAREGRPLDRQAQIPIGRCFALRSGLRYVPFRFS
jgi:hypothetical protein